MYSDAETEDQGNRMADAIEDFQTLMEMINDVPVVFNGELLKKWDAMKEAACAWRKGGGNDI